VWTREIDGQVLTFHLAGINNQNFLMRDEETGSFWQQINGKAVSGPLAGRKLTLVHCDELMFATWKAENPEGSVLQPVAKFAEDYEPKDWEGRMARAKTVVNTKDSGHPPRELMLGIAAFGASRAFPLERVLEQKVIQDELGGEPILLVVGVDGQSVRAFRRTLPQGGSSADFFRVTNPEPAKPALLVDSVFGSEWGFQGCALKGKARGTCLEPVDMIKDYWFDWRKYNPRTTVYSR
jgi:hypothetical protein